MGEPRFRANVRVRAVVGWGVSARGPGFATPFFGAGALARNVPGGQTEGDIKIQMQGSDDHATADQSPPQSVAPPTPNHYSPPPFGA
jgi:hypothetical protein